LGNSISAQSWAYLVWLWLFFPFLFMLLILLHDFGVSPLGHDTVL
jgi:hypothetical protein